MFSFKWKLDLKYYLHEIRASKILFLPTFFVFICFRVPSFTAINSSEVTTEMAECHDTATFLKL